jgi:multiple sugar transport system ATP-binding protein
MADKIVVMKDGLVEQIGGPLDLYDNPVNTFVAGFIGSPAMNMIPGVARVANGTGRIEFADASSVAFPLNAHAQDGQAVLFGMRPEHCGVNHGGALAAKVHVVEPTGADTQIYCKYLEQEITATVRDRTDCRPGDTIMLSPDLAHAHLFDAASGKRLVV